MYRLSPSPEGTRGASVRLSAVVLSYVWTAYQEQRVSPADQRALHCPIHTKVSEHVHRMIAEIRHTGNPSLAAERFRRSKFFSGRKRRRSPSFVSQEAQSWLPAGQLSLTLFRLITLHRLSTLSDLGRKTTHLHSLETCDGTVPLPSAHSPGAFAQIGQMPLGLTTGEHLQVGPAPAVFARRSWLDPSRSSCSMEW
jgi:hypothetical protein